VRQGLASKEGPSPDTIVKAGSEEVILRGGDRMGLDGKKGQHDNGFKEAR